MKHLLKSTAEGSKANAEAISNEKISYFKIIQQISSLLINSMISGNSSLLKKKETKPG